MNKIGLVAFGVLTTVCVLGWVAFMGTEVHAKAIEPQEMAHILFGDTEKCIDIQDHSVYSYTDVVDIILEDGTMAKVDMENVVISHGECFVCGRNSNSET